MGLVQPTGLAIAGGSNQNYSWLSPQLSVLNQLLLGALTANLNTPSNLQIKDEKNNVMKQEPNDAIKNEPKFDPNEVIDVSSEEEDFNPGASSTKNAENIKTEEDN